MSLDAVVDLLRCPHCRQRFVSGPPSLRCASGHAFDVSRGGQLNLLGAAQPVNADTAAMITAREQVLAAGVFDATTAAVAAAVPAGASVIVDAGAGPGHHLAAVLDGESRRRGLAIDVSVAACRRAAKAHDRIGAVVADVWRDLPVIDGCADVVLSVFAPRNGAEFARVLGRDATLIIVTPRTDHLEELRDRLQLLGIQPGKDSRLAESLAEDFRPVTQQDVTERSDWSADLARLAVAMGPNAFHTSPGALDERLARLTWPQQVTVATRISVWRRR